MKTAVILSGGKGSRIWPYSDTQNKGMIEIANKPILSYIVDDLIELGIEEIFIISSTFSQGIKSFFKKEKIVNVVEENESNGPANSLIKFYENHKDKLDEFLVLYGDVILEKNDIKKIVESKKSTSVLLRKLEREKIKHSIAVNYKDGKILDILGHPRKDNYNHEICGYKLNKKYIDEYLVFSKDTFENLQVGMMPSNEHYIENSLLDYISDENILEIIKIELESFNIDYPWNILEATKYMTEKLCLDISENTLLEGSSIHKECEIKGIVKLGKNSKIGKNVLINGNIIVGDNTIIDNGAIINANVIIGNNCRIQNYCHISENTTIGDDCIVDHCAEIEGILYKKVYLYHFMEVYGIIGRNTDIGAGTLFGSLRFDDCGGKHIVNGVVHYPKNYSNAVYIGDYCRTGVGSMIMPGIKVGSRSVVGSGVLLGKDLPTRKSIFLKQDLIIKDWSENKYGW